MSTAHPHPPAPTGTGSPARPGFIECLLGLIAMVAATAVLPFLGPFGLGLDEDPVVYGLLVAAWSGVVGLIGFAAAALIRIRSWGAFSVRRTTWRWMALGVLGGLVALVAKYVLVSAVTMFTDFGDTDPQGMYYDAAGGGALAGVLTLLFLAVLTPIGEEFLFRGVITNALLRHGPLIGVLGGSVIFALAHGINIILPVAILVGIIAAELMRRSGSIWPAVAVHAVNNAVLPLLVMVTGYSGPS
ncbi:type II CAAX prenyl endopeptidase Rce1 family protein [Nocardiopsis sediminis]|uniref:Type II CAAX prenyl endopeptidase Rce1 family protein n=1 Tax=Nocardiopsis sediminis TaxID=1778267 RepID=A0ABV8FN22_9ACTN